MTNKFGIRYSVDFFEDLDAITSYIKNELKNGIVANRLIEKVDIAIEKPISYEKYNTYGGYTYYKIYVDHYIIFYTVIEDVMEIRNIKYHKRDFSKLI